MGAPNTLTRVPADRGNYARTCSWCGRKAGLTLIDGVWTNRHRLYRYGSEPLYTGPAFCNVGCAGAYLDFTRADYDWIEYAP